MISTENCIHSYNDGLFHVCHFTEYQKDISKHKNTFLITGFNGINEKSYKYVIIP